IYQGALHRIGPILRASPKNPMMQSLRVECAMGLARLGDHAAAAAEAEATLALVEPSGLNLYNLACAFSLARRAALADAAPGRSEREQLAASYGSRAVELLERALAAGYFNQRDNAVALGTDADLEAIRPLGGFKDLESRVSGIRRNPKP